MDNKFINFYGRTTGHLSKRAVHLLESLLPEYLLNMDNFYTNLGKYEKVNLEIGFGSGDFLFNSAASNPSFLYVGVEVFANGVASLLDKIDKYNTEKKDKSLDSSNENLKNILIYNSNVYYLLSHLKENTFDNLFILFPDPWHKNKHHKRRLINENNLAVFSKILKPNGILRFVSDHKDYVAWALEQFKQSSQFKIDDSQDFAIPPTDHFQTKYERKAVKAGRDISYINVQNIN
ncbi:MAG: tRNA (guanosine(46)-N7)-methyltransferase TrmB [Alphaproteobacteria bacterium]|nr:tRNA (guanosine(46)-N7)-methyltransferase TrmB [Alphaproteobacteria bacterium]